MKKCIICNGPLPKGKSKCCSTECYNQHRKNYALANRITKVCVCVTCGNEFTVERHRPAKYCSLKCSNRIVFPWEAEAIRLYQFEELGCKRIAKRIGAKPAQVRAVIKRAGLLNPQYQRDCEDNRRKTCAVGGRSRKQVDAHALIMRDYRCAQRKLAKFDESRHWRCHPERLKYRFTANGMVKASKLQYHVCKARKDNYWLSKKLRSRIYYVLKGLKKSAPTLELLGCSLEQFRAHLESQFKDGMTWDNYGSHWHIDHILSCAGYDLSKPEQQRECFHYTNMQPLLAHDNRVKWASL